MSELEIEVCDCDEVHADIVNEVRAHMPEEYLLDDLAEVFKVFGDKTRMKILYILHERELCVCDIAQLLDMNQSAISHQLKVLKQAKLIKNRRDGKQMYYSLADDHVHTILSMGMEHIMEK
ncbi:MAG: winged helix-turn-helix transcriptional regulator [Lachnospira sp.]|nr:winged helix-turn-helix transcriptional regulator [Lachnospira sp.]